MDLDQLKSKKSPKSPPSGKAGLSRSDYDPTYKEIKGLIYKCLYDLTSQYLFSCEITTFKTFILP